MAVPPMLTLGGIPQIIIGRIVRDFQIGGHVVIVVLLVIEVGE